MSLKSLDYFFFLFKYMQLQFLRFFLNHLVQKVFLELWTELVWIVFSIL